MKNEKKVKRILKAVNRYLIFFLLIAFVTTCCMSLFLNVMANSMGIDYTEVNIASAAKLTFGNVVLLSLIITVIDALRRKFTVDRPVKKIKDAADKIMQGDYSVRIDTKKSIAANDNINEISESFNKMAKELSSVETLREDFIANVSHEMKTPLTVMQNYGTLLQKPNLSEEKRMEYAKGVTEATRRLSNVMTNILKLNRLENQQIFPKTTEFDLSEQLCLALLQFENEWEKNDINIETDIEEGVKIKADAELLSLVWNNLLSNAFKFTDKGGTVSLSLKSSKQHITVTVKDSGCGMSQEVGAHIFEKFYQADTSRAVSGNGLGLALVKKVIDILHGEISVESAINKGSAFTVKIRKN